MSRTIVAKIMCESAEDAILFAESAPLPPSMTLSGENGSAELTLVWTVMDEPMDNTVGLRFTDQGVIVFGIGIDALTDGTNT